MRLVAERGVDVSVRDINKAAGQKNAGSINYYFQSREDLIRELTRDVAAMLADAHARRLDALEARGGPHCIRDVVEILVELPSPDKWGASTHEYAVRFFNTVLIHKRDMMFDAVRGLDGGTRRCLAHIQRMAPAMPREILQQRLRLIMVFLITAVSLREASRNSPEIWGKLWATPASEDNLADVITTVINAPVSDQTMKALEAL